MREKRYFKNGIFSDEDQKLLKNKKVAVIGCGGLGGYIIEMLARLGVGQLVICDGDTFDETNLNRQILATENNLGCNKALEAAKRVLDVNPLVGMTVHDYNLTNQNGRSIIDGCDLVVDALDSPRDKVLLEGLCEEMRITMVHGAISGWFGQVAVGFPGEEILKRYYESQGDETEALGNPSFTPALVGALQVSESIKLLLGTGDHLTGGIMLIDLYYNETEFIEV